MGRYLASEERCGDLEHPPTIANTTKRSVLVFLISVGLLLFVSVVARSAFATCTANITMSQVGTGNVAVTLSGKGSCTANGMNGGRVELWEGSVMQASCPDGQCDFSYEYGASCGNTQTRALTVMCWRTAANGDCEVDPDPGHDTDSVTLSHANSLTLLSAYDYPTVGGTTAVVANLRVHAPDAWGNRGLVTTWLRPDGTTTVGPYQAIGADAFVDLDVQVSGDGPAGSTLLVTLISCGDKKSTVKIDVGGTYSCTGAGSCPTNVAPALSSTFLNPPQPTGCVGTPIRLSDGDMQMAEIDPLPVSPGTGLKRTYLTNAPSEGWFGTHWASMFDRALQVFSDVTDGPWAVVWLDGTKRYVFQSANGAWSQAWPEATIPATLTTEASTGNYLLREPGNDTEVVIDAQIGYPLKYRSRSSGRALNITYNGTTPARVDDSWGTFGWTITTSNHRVDSIAVDGTSLTWQYVYTGNLLTQVNGPGGTAWRTYTYSSNRLTEARDAAGRLLESHSYDGSGRATTSVQSEDDIQSINF